MAYKIVRKDGVFGDSSLPGMPSVVDVTVRNGIQVVADDQKTAVIGALQLLSLSQTSSAGSDPIIGDLNYLLFSVGTTWLNDLVAQGYAVLISYPVTNIPKVIATKTSSVISQYATASGGYAIVDGPQALISAATGTPVVPPSTTICNDPGDILDPVTSECYSPSNPSKPPYKPVPVTAVITQTPSETPGWVWPVLIGGIALVLVGAAVVNKPKRTSYAMNMHRSMHGKHFWVMSKTEYTNMLRKRKAFRKVSQSRIDAMYRGYRKVMADVSKI